MPTKTQRRASRRLPRGVLTPGLIVEESLRLLDSAGTSGFSLPKLGRVLGADPTAIYRYFQSKDDLVLAIADRMLEEALAGFTPAKCWVDTLADLARRLRRVYRTHPAAATISSSRTTRRPAEMHGVEWVLCAIREAGFEGFEAAVAYRSFVDFALFFAGGEARFLSLEPEQREADLGAWTQAYRAVDPEEFPHIAALSRELTETSDDLIYEHALACHLAGLTARAPLDCPCAPGTHDLQPA